MAEGHEIAFEAVWDHQHVVAMLYVDASDVAIEVAAGKVLMMPLGVFEQLATRAIVAAHTIPTEGAP